jgi:hypothetical protein
MTHECIDLEKSLLERSTRRNKDIVEKLFADDFFEFGSSGKIYNKEDVHKALSTETVRNFKAIDFKATHLTDNSVLITYKLFEGENITLRSSIWCHNANYGWQMIFHQGTKCPL